MCSAGEAARLSGYFGEHLRLPERFRLVQNGNQLSRKLHGIFTECFWNIYGFRGGSGRLPKWRSVFSSNIARFKSRHDDCSFIAISPTGLGSRMSAPLYTIGSSVCGPHYARLRLVSAPRSPLPITERMRCERTSAGLEISTSGHKLPICTSKNLGSHSPATARFSDVSCRKCGRRLTQILQLLVPEAYSTSARTTFSCERPVSSL